MKWISVRPGEETPSWLKEIESNNIPASLRFRGEMAKFVSGSAPPGEAPPFMYVHDPLTAIAGIVQRYGLGLYMESDPLVGLEIVRRAHRQEEAYRLIRELRGMGCGPVVSTVTGRVCFKKGTIPPDHLLEWLSENQWEVSALLKIEGATITPAKKEPPAPAPASSFDTAW